MRYFFLLALLAPSASFASIETVRAFERSTSFVEEAIKREPDPSSARTPKPAIDISMPKVKLGAIALAPQIANFTSVGVAFKLNL